MSTVFDKNTVEIRRMSDDSVVKVVEGILKTSVLLGYSHNSNGGEIPSQIKYSKNKKWKRGRMYNGEMVYCVYTSGEIYERYKNS